MNRPKSIIALLSITLAFWSCHNDDINPGDELENYLNEVINIMEVNFFQRDRIDWESFREQVFATAKAAEIPEQKSQGIRQALTLLSDADSYWINPAGQQKWGGTDIGCRSDANFSGTVPDQVGYFRIDRFRPFDENIEDYIETAHARIRKMDNESIKGWVVDLRDNYAMDMFPMLAAVGPILGEGIAGNLVYSDSPTISFGYREGGTFLGETILTQAPDPYQLLVSNSKVAVILGQATRRAGEAIALAFSGRENTRFFGTTTCGQSTIIQDFQLSDNTQLSLAVGFIADRNLKDFDGDSVVPDEFANPDEVLQKASDWVKE